MATDETSTFEPAGPCALASDLDPRALLQTLRAVAGLALLAFVADRHLRR